MHTLATLSVLMILGLIMTVIGGMLFTHRGRIIAALTGCPVRSDCNATVTALSDHHRPSRAARHVPKRTLPPLPLAA